MFGVGWPCKRVETPVTFWDGHVASAWVAFHNARLGARRESNVINGTADLASTSWSEGDPLRADFQQIQQAGERAASLTRQLLAFSRMRILKPDVLDLSTLRRRCRACSSV